MLAVDSPPRLRQAARPLRLVNLLNDLDELVHLLHGVLAEGSALNAFLLAAGIGQVTEDYLYSDGTLLVKAAAHLRVAGNGGRAAAAAVTTVESSRRMLGLLWGGDEPVERWLTEVQSLTTSLAPLALSGEHAGWREGSTARARRLFETHLDLPARLRTSIIRLPSCFRSFDQHPDDMKRLASRFGNEFPDRGRPATVVGVRTSGSYLAPLVASALEGLGFVDVTWLTMRPGSPLGARQRRAIQHARRGEGIFLVVDDPPTTGGSYRRAALALGSLGVRPESLVLLVPLGPGAVEPPDAIKSYRSVLLRWPDWAINDRLEAAAVRESLSGLFAAGRRIDSIKRLSLDAPVRGHASARFAVNVTDVEETRRKVLDVHAAAVGLGYFGEHSLAVARQLRRFSPHLHGLVDGVLLRERLPDRRRLERMIVAGDPRATASVVDYVVARRDALRVSDDTARRLRGRMPAWEAVSNIFSRAFGRGWAWSRLPLVDPVIKECLRVDVPSVIDGSMAVNNWFAGDRWPQSTRKVDTDRRAFANLDLASYDAIFDLASLAVDAELLGANSEAAYRHAYEDATATAITPERWFLLQALHLWDRQRLGDGDESALRRAMSRAAQRYFAEGFLSDTEAPVSGRFAALDVDGVLEGEAAGFSSLTRASATALRALLRHGFRPVLMTGRSLAEVRDRCVSLHLAGGVAEYGSVLYDHATGVTRSMLSAAQLEAVRRAREAVSGLTGVALDPAYEHSVRAFRPAPEGHRRAPDAGVVRSALLAAGVAGSVEMIAGDSQIDIVAAGVSKGRALAELVAGYGSGPVALAVGDGTRDVSAFRAARLAVAPAHAPAVVRAAARVTRHGYQAGLLEAVGMLIGHRPGGCRTCSLPAMPRERVRLLALLSAQERGGVTGMMRAAAAILWASR